MQAGHTREQFNDAINLKEIVKAATIQTEQLDDISRRYNFDLWADDVKNKFENDEDQIFSWSEFGKDIGAFFSSAVTFNPMLGPLSNEVKVRKQANRAKVIEKNKVSQK